MLDTTGRQLAERYASVAETCARRFFGHVPMASLDELRGVAYLGLVQALDRWPDYCKEHGWDAADLSYIVAFVQRRINGSLIDWARSADHLTRTARQAVKALHAAQDEGNNGQAVAVAAARLNVTEAVVRAAAVAAGQRPTSLDLTNEFGDSYDFPDPEVVEEQAGANLILSAATAAISGLTERQRLILVLCRYYALDADAVAQVLGIDPVKVQELHRRAMFAVHEGMLKAAVTAG